MAPDTEAGMSNPKFPRPREIRHEPGYGIGIAFLALLVAPLLYAFGSPGSDDQVAGGAFFLLLAFVFLLSYFQSHRSFLFRWFEWLCEHGSVPASRKMAFFYFFIALFVGVAHLWLAS